MKLLLPSNEAWLKHVPIGISVFSLIISGLTFIVNWKLNQAQPELISAVATQDYYDTELVDKYSVVAICRTKLYINNFGTADTVLDSISSTTLIEHIPGFKPLRLDYQVDLLSRSDYIGFAQQGIRVLTAFHNWGSQPPSLAEVFGFYNKFGPTYAKQYVDLNAQTIGIVNLIDPSKSGIQRMQSRYGSGVTLAPRLFIRQYPPVILKGKQLTTVTVDNVAFYYADKPQQSILLGSRNFGGEVDVEIRTVDKRTSSKHHVACQTNVGF